MTIQYDAINIHWNYFIALERDFETISRYVEPCEANNQTYSLELARLIMTATQEVDVVLKSFCRILDPSKYPEKILQYYSVVNEYSGEFVKERVLIPRFGMSSQPWINWSAKSPPIWWTANNKIKHQRATFFHLANLKNAFNALGALMIAVAYLQNHSMTGNSNQYDWHLVTDSLKPQSALFRLNRSYYRFND